MRDDIRNLQTLLADYLRDNKLTQEKFAERAEGLNRGKIGYILNGNATTVDIALLASLAVAMRLPFATLAAKIGLLAAAPMSEGKLLEEFQSVAELVPEGQREAMSAELRELIERARTTLSTR